MIIMNSKISKKGLVLFLVLILLLIGSIATARIAASNVNKKYIESNEKKDQGIHDWGYNSKSGEYNNFRNYNEIGKLTSDILNNQNGFIGVSDPTIFLGKVYKYEGWNGLQATEYANGMCAAHYQSNTLGGDNVYYIANVIDINTDPDNLGITIYGGKRTEKEGTRLYVTDEKNDVPNSADVGNAVASAIWISLSDPNYLQCDKDENGNDIKSMRTCHKIVSYALENYITTIARELDEEFLKKNKYGYRTEYRNNTVVNSNNVDIRKYLNSEFSNFHLDTGWKNNGVPQGVKDQIYAAKTVATTHKVTVESAKVNNKEIADITYKGDYAYIGPLKITSEGEKTFKLKSITVNGQKASLVKKGALDTDITSGSSGGDNYYAKIKNKTITTATVKVTTESSSSVPYYKARILVCIAPASNKQNQNTLIYAAQKSTTGSDSDDSVTIERKTTKVQLQKTDSADKALSLSGIKFEIYKGEVKSENKKGTLETGSDGKTGEIELEAGTYTVKETVNNAYGYKQNKDVTTTIKIEESDISKNIVTKNIKNTKELGNLQITKISDVKDNGKEITLSGAQFKIGTGVDDKFIQLTDTNKKKIGTVPGSATISTDGSNIKYVAESEATIFKTDSNGIIELKNLEVYSAKNIKYNYQIKEINTGNSNYTILNETTSAKLDNNTTKSVTIKNKLSYIDLSGKVWLDVPQGKAYTGNNEYDSNDKKLKDIKVILYDTVNKKNIANTKTDENGNYKFTRVSRDNLKNYSVVFEYDGLKYTSVTLANNINETNKSKAKEVWGDNATTEKTRQFVNSKYTNIPDNGNAIKTAAGNNIVQASTQEAGDKFNLSKATIDVKAKEIKNIDLGLFTREQPDISITDDITSLIVKVKDSQYIYNYEHIGDAKEEREAKNQTVNLTAKVAKKGKLYASDIKSFQDSVAKMEVYVIYGIQIKNESQTLKTNIKQVNEFYDIEKFDLSSGYSIGSNANNGNLEGANKYKVTEVANANGEPKLNKLEITFNQELKLEPGQKEMIYLKFKLNDETVKGVLNKDAAIYNVATIAKYESNYFEGVDENGKKIETYEGSGTSRKDKIYAGLDKDSIPNNEEIQFEKDGQGNNKLYDMNLKATTDQSKGHAEIDADKLKSKGNFGIDLYEDDAFSAPTFVLYADSVRKIEGTAFEDKSTVNNDNERKGNGKLDNNENKLKDITVELLEAESGNVAKYSDGITEVRAKTDKNGNYTFGKYDTSDPSNIKYLGILPGKYKIRFTYTDGTTKIVENNNEKNVSLLEYKSTIITDENIKTAMENNTRNQRWYLAESVKTGANSIAADDYQKVTELNNLEINNELLNNMNGREMPAYSPMLEIGVEYETIDTMDVEKYEYNNGFTIKEVHTFIDKISNMDFGIVEKPHAVVQAIKRVENIIYQNAKGNTLFYGDPTKDAKIQYVKTYYVNDADKSNGKVEAEIDSDLIQGATLNVIYALKIRNESETDYNTKDYYYYGTKGTEAQKSKINITKVADYMTKDLVFDEQSTNQKNTGAWIKKDLDNNFKKLIDTSIVKTDGYQILMSETYGEIKQNDTAEKYLYATVRTSTSSNTEFINGMEILGYKGGKRIQNTTPGNYNPNNIVNTQNVNPEKDSSFMITVISAPTGKDINYTPYIVIAIVTLTMVAVAIVIIKRKITK